MRLNSDYVPVFLEWLDTQNAKPIESTNPYNPKYRWVWLGEIYWAYETSQGLQVHSKQSTDTIKESFASAITLETEDNQEKE